MPGVIHDVRYAALVQDTEATARALLDHCGLPFEAGCIDTASNPAPVATLSSAQVREPIHARALQEWRRYAAQLEAAQAGAGLSPSCVPHKKRAGTCRPFLASRLLRLYLPAPRSILYSTQNARP